MHYDFNDKRYYAVPPQADTDLLCEQGDRLMIRHNLGKNPTIFVARIGILTAGWVIGLFPGETFPKW